MESYIIETARLTLVPMQSTDVGAVYQISNQSGVRKYLFDDKPVCPAFIDAIFQQSISNFEARNFGIWILRKKRTPEIVGFCGLRSVEHLAEIAPAVVLSFGVELGGRERVLDDAPAVVLSLLSESKWHFGYAIEAACAVQSYAFDRARLDR